MYKRCAKCMQRLKGSCSIPISQQKQSIGASISEFSLTLWKVGNTAFNREKLAIATCHHSILSSPCLGETFAV